MNSLLERAKAVLQSNDAGSFTRPGPLQYPHQWNWDTALIALGLSFFDLPRALTEIRSLLQGQWRDGMVPHIVYHRGKSHYFPDPDFWQIQKNPNAPAVPTSGITNPPLLTTIVRRLHERYALTDFVREVYPSLWKWHHWLHTNRCVDQSGLVCIVHPWESGTDDAPRWLDVLASIHPEEVPDFERGDIRYVSPAERPQQAEYERFIYLIDVFRKIGYEPFAMLEKSPFLVQDVLFNSIVYRANCDLRALAIELGQPTDEVDSWIRSMETHFEARFWNPQKGLYYDYDLRRGASIMVNTVATFMPLFAGLASASQARRLVEEHLLNPLEYAPGSKVRYWITTVSQSEPTWEPQRYWRGPVWILINWFIIEGLRQYAYDDLAEKIRLNTIELLSSSGFYEYYNPCDGSGCGSADFSWSAALAFELQMGR